MKRYLGLVLKPKGTWNVISITALVRNAMSDLDLYLIQIRPRDVRKPKEFQLSRHYFFKRNSEALVENEISVTELELAFH